MNNHGMLSSVLAGIILVKCFMVLGFRIIVNASISFSFMHILKTGISVKSCIPAKTDIIQYYDSFLGPVENKTD